MDAKEYFKDIQDFLNNHYSDLLKTLGGYTLSLNEAKAMHELLEARRSALNNANFHFHLVKIQLHPKRRRQS